MVARITFSYEEWTGIYQTQARSAPNHLPVHKQPPITKNYPHQYHNTQAENP